MTTNNWKRELNHLLEIFEIESTISLGKIIHYFEAEGRPFDDKFREYFLEKSTQRLNTSFDTVLLNGCSKTPKQMIPNPSASKPAVNNSNLVEIRSNTSPKSNNDAGDFDDKHIGSDSNIENFIEDFVKREFNVGSEIQSDPETDDCVTRNDLAETDESFWENVLAELRENNAKLFKCAECDHVTKRKHDLAKHQKVHEFQRSKGIAKNPIDGLYKCSDCDLQFTKWSGLKCHLTVSHRNNRSAFSCKHCTYLFPLEIKRDRHEFRCKSRRYECYLCKQYVTSYVNDMREHMRTHSGVKPLECTVCRQCFRHKKTLTRHSNTSHKDVIKHKIDETDDFV